jgi:hypothetical protein
MTTIRTEPYALHGYTITFLGYALWRVERPDGSRVGGYHKTYRYAVSAVKRDRKGQGA